MFDDGKFHVIPAVRSLKFFSEALRTEEEWILTSNCAHIGNLQSLSHKCHDANKKIIVNHEIVGGLGADKTAFEFLKKMYHVDCVMGVHNIRLGMVKNEGMKTIQRITLSDSFALEQAAKSLQISKADAIELRPAYYAAEFLDYFKKIKDCCYIAGGFIDSKDTVDIMYRAGFNGITTSNEKLWNYQIR